MPKIVIERAPARIGSDYPPPLDEPCNLLRRWKLGAAAGLTQFGVNLTRIPPGQWTSQRHWHTAEDEFVWVVEGEVVLVSSCGEEILRSGDCAGFAAAVPDGHHIQNRSDREAVLLEDRLETTRGRHLLLSGQPCDRRAWIESSSLRRTGMTDWGHGYPPECVSLT